MQVVDLDGDTDMDILLSTHNFSSLSEGNKIAWYKNLDGQGTFGDLQVIAIDRTLAFHASDIDGDGDLDVVSASGAQLRWYENLDGNGTFGIQKATSMEDGSTVTTVVSGDFDGDGDLDVLVGLGGGFAWFRNTDGTGAYEQQQSIATDYPSRLYTADLDGDGDLDISTRREWYENTDGDGLFVKGRRLSGYPVDWDQDGDPDLLPLEINAAWLENEDGNGTYARRRKIGEGNLMAAADLNGDGLLDAVTAPSATDSIYYWYPGVGGGAAEREPRLIETGTSRRGSLAAEDLDGDGDIDLVLLTGLKISWFENMDGEGNFSSQRLVTRQTAAESVHAADLDGDGDHDVLAALVNDAIVWRENTDGDGTFGPPRNVSVNAESPESVHTADLDGDGDLDVLAALESQDVNKFVWYENLDGNGSFGPEQTFESAVDLTSQSWGNSILPADLDGDDDVDVVTASTNQLSWYENVDGKGEFGPTRAISENFIGTNTDQSVYAADLDGDGDLDVLSFSTGNSGSVIWYENLNGRGTFGPPRLISEEVDVAFSVVAADLDGDRDADVLSVSHDKVAWHENIDGKGAFGPQNVIDTPEHYFTSAQVADMDGDGDLDVLSAGIADFFGIVFGSSITLYENTDGSGKFEQQRQLPTTEGQGPVAVRVADIDGDNDPDVLVANRGEDATAITLYENRLEGDIDDDGEVTFSDFLVLSSNFGKEGTGWEDGDLDSDGVVRLSDFLILADGFGDSRRTT